MNATPHEIGVMVAHQAIDYGLMIERLEGGAVLPMLKRAIFVAVRDAIIQKSKLR